MKYLFLFLIAIMPLSLSAEKKVSKIYYNDYDGYSETEFLTYDENGHLVSFKSVTAEITLFDQTIEYVGKSKVILDGITDGVNGVFEASLNESGLATSIHCTVDGESETGYLSYSNGLISKANDVVYEITDDNPTRILTDYWGDGYPTITYSNKPNKCGLIYLPIITQDVWLCRALAYAGLLGYGSVKLPYSCNFHPNRENDHIIDYVIDDEGYVISMDIENGGGECDGHYVFEYCEVNGVDDAETAAVEVSGGKNCIIVKGEYDSIKVYNLSGMQCDATTDLTPGIYIVDVDSTKSKVWVY